MKEDKSNEGDDRQIKPVTNPIALDEDRPTTDEQRRVCIGPDFDPFYSEKLNAFFQDHLGPLGPFKPND